MDLTTVTVLSWLINWVIQEKLMSTEPVKSRSNRPLSRAPSPWLGVACVCLLPTALSTLFTTRDSKVWTLTFSAASRPSDRWRKSFVSSLQIIHFTHKHTEKPCSYTGWEHSNCRLVTGWYFTVGKQCALWQSQCLILTISVAVPIKDTL